MASSGWPTLQSNEQEKKATLTTKCPLCGANAMEEKRGEYRFDPPPNIAGGTIVITDATWRECSKCGEALLGYELSKALDREAIKRQDGKDDDRYSHAARPPTVGREPEGSG
jgi:YgiT-type zinc finger domain-containing protein